MARISRGLDSGSDRPRPATRSLIDDSRIDIGTIMISAIAVWEIAQLVDTGRIDLDRSVEDWLQRFIARPDLEVVPLTPSAAARS